MIQEDAGKSFITLDMDESRELRWNFRNMQKFESRAKDILKRHEVKNERGQLISSMAINTGFVLANFMKIADIMEAAVASAIGVSGLEGKKGEPSEAVVAIQGYLDRGGDLETLQKEIYHSYLLVNDPSSVEEWQGNVAREAEIKRINKEKAAAQVEIARMELANDQKKIETLRKASGSTPTDLPT
jgi:hypothetical protein